MYHLFKRNCFRIGSFNDDFFSLKRKWSVNIEFWWTVIGKIYITYLHLRSTAYSGQTKSNSLPISSIKKWSTAKTIFYTFKTKDHLSHFPVKGLTHKPNPNCWEAHQELMRLKKPVVPSSSDHYGETVPVHTWTEQIRYNPQPLKFFTSREVKKYPLLLPYNYKILHFFS